MSYLIREIFGGGDPMYGASRHFRVTDKKFYNDPDALGVYVDSDE